MSFWKNPTNSYKILKLFRNEFFGSKSKSRTEIQKESILQAAGTERYERVTYKKRLNEIGLV